MAMKHPSVEKRARQNVLRNRRNTMIRSALRTAVKKVNVALDRGDSDLARAELPRAVRALGKASSKGVIHSNQASRKISRLTRRVNALAATQS
ncbi:30S ribosomal protein S20 [Candidatus Entotheonellaceae bacterium PAL068K]